MSRRVRTLTPAEVVTLLGQVSYSSESEGDFGEFDPALTADGSDDALNLYEEESDESDEPPPPPITRSHLTISQQILE